VPGPLGSGAHNLFTPILEFFREYNDRYYTGTELVADVAVLRNWPSMAYSISAAYVPTTLMEQILIQYKVPFDLLFDEFIDRLPRYKAVLLAGQECVSDAQAAQLMAYVRNGGTLLLAGNTGSFNEWRETRESNPFLPARAEGKGHIVVLPEIVAGESGAKGATQFQDPEPGATASRGVQMAPPQWVLPKNHAVIHENLIAAIPGGPSITTEAPLTTVMEILARPESNETLIHFVNFETKAPAPAFAVQLRRKGRRPLKSVTCLSPDHDEPVTVSVTETNGWANFTVPGFKTYSMIVVAD
jgi:hypothetical protein